MCRLGVALQPWLVHPIQIKFECFIFFLNLNVLIFSYLNLLQNSLVLTGCMIMFFDGFKTCFVLMGWMKLVWLLTKHWYNSGAKRSSTVTEAKIHSIQDQCTFVPDTCCSMFMLFSVLMSTASVPNCPKIQTEREHAACCCWSSNPDRFQVLHWVWDYLAYKN